MDKDIIDNAIGNQKPEALENMAERFKCVLFDMDGVLYNSMPNHAVA